MQPPCGKGSSPVPEKAAVFILEPRGTVLMAQVRENRWNQRTTGGRFSWRRSGRTAGTKEPRVDGSHGAAQGEPLEPKNHEWTVLMAQLRENRWNQRATGYGSHGAGQGEPLEPKNHGWTVLMAQVRENRWNQRATGGRFSWRRSGRTAGTKEPRVDGSHGAAQCEPREPYPVVPLCVSHENHPRGTTQRIGNRPFADPCREKERSMYG